jgi:hypothetical protein
MSAAAEDPRVKSLERVVVRRPFSTIVLEHASIAAPSELFAACEIRLKEIIPTYGIDLTQDAAALRKTRAETAVILKVENI